jgi:hypothetical protein
MLGIVFANASGQAATLTWERGGPFETCLQARMDQWIGTQAERIVNEDPAAAELDDTDVALWAASAIEGCEAQAGRGDRSSEARFARHMAHWREHIDEVAQGIRQRGRAD